MGSFEPIEGTSLPFSSSWVYSMSNEQMTLIDNGLILSLATTVLVYLLSLLLFDSFINR